MNKSGYLGGTKKRDGKDTDGALYMSVHVEGKYR